MTTEVRTTGWLATPVGGTVQLRLLISGDRRDTQVRIHREERRPHKTLEWTVLEVVQPTEGIYSLARDMTTVMCELERLHHKGYWLRQRAGGGWRGAWRADLMPPKAARAALSWQIRPRRPGKELAALVGRISSLDVPTYRSDRSLGEDTALIATMQDHGNEVRRQQAIDALIAADPAAPMDDFLRALDAPDAPS